MSGISQHHAHLDHQAQHQRALAENFAAHFLVVNGVRAVVHQPVTLGRREEPVGELVALNDQADGLLRFLLQVDDFFPFAADIGRMQQTRACVGRKNHAHGDRNAGQDGNREEQSQLTDNRTANSR